MHVQAVTATLPFRPTGFRIVYHRGATNHCPACGHTQWIVGRSSAECAFCDTAVPLAMPYQCAA